MWANDKGWETRIFSQNAGQCYSTKMRDNFLGGLVAGLKIVPLCLMGQDEAKVQSRSCLYIKTGFVFLYRHERDWTLVGPCPIKQNRTIFKPVTGLPRT